jgi:dolichyl-phosphate-mannose--protein O-mannosyl transferase
VYGTDHFDWLHPPLAKYIQAGFFNVLGSDAAAWRAASAVFGVIGIVLIFAVTQAAFHRPAVSVLAAFLLSLDGLWLVQSRVAMNDVFVAVWLLAAAWMYLLAQKKRTNFRLLLMTGLFLGLALATKWSAVLWMMGLLVWEGAVLLKMRAFRHIPWMVFCFLAVPLAVYSIAFIPVLLQGKTVSYLFEWHQQIMAYQLAGGGAHPAQSEPWQWILNAAPVWYWHGDGARNIIAFNNPLLAWLAAGGIFASVLVLARRRAVPQPMAFFITLFGCYLLPLAWSPRILFYYHFTPLLPLGAIILAYWLNRLYFYRTNRWQKLAGFTLLACLVWTFWLFYPYWTGLPVTDDFMHAILGILPGWQ